MTKTTVNEFTKTYSGIFGNEVVLKSRKGLSTMTIPAKVAEKEPTTVQNNVRDKFILASKYAKNVLKNPDLLAAYGPKRENERSMYHMVMTNFLKRPVVVQINSDRYHGNPGDLISVSAYDDVRVTGVTLEIIDPDNKVVEQGSCTFNPVTSNYDYHATCQGTSGGGLRLRASVFNIPDHMGTLEVII